MLQQYQQRAITKYSEHRSTKQVFVAWREFATHRRRTTAIGATVITLSRAHDSRRALEAWAYRARISRLARTLQTRR
jgi:hypothetical protein